MKVKGKSCSAFFFPQSEFSAFLCNTISSHFQSFATEIILCAQPSIQRLKNDKMLPGILAETTGRKNKTWNLLMLPLE